MKKFKKGDIVGRKSYNKDVIFEITNIIKVNKNDKIYILKGITHRIEADCEEKDLELIDKRIASQKEIKIDDEILEKIQNYLKHRNEDRVLGVINENKKINKSKIYTGKILHLDGDRKYSEKSLKYYKSLGFNAIVKNVPEYKQPKVVVDLLNRYNPDILIITGHDGMIKKGSNFNDIYNYRNSKHFMNTVNMARKWNSPKSSGLAIFAGACQSFYEAIMSAGANFASSPKRIMIDFIDPLIVAQKIATTDNTKYISINDLESELRDGRDGIDGVGAMGKKYKKY